MKSIAYLYVFDGMADWEPCYLVAELNSKRFFKDRSLKCEIKTASNSKAPVSTIGGLKILPDASVDEISIEDALILILPGGHDWLEPLHEPIFEKVGIALKSGTLVAAICGATAGLAKHGFLDSVKHTSNDLSYLKSECPSYAGEALYTSLPAQSDKGLITASGAAPLDFAYESLKCLGVFSEETLNLWFELYRTREPKLFHALMKSLPQQDLQPQDANA